MKNMIFFGLMLFFVSANSQFLHKEAIDQYPFYGNENPITIRTKIILLQRDDGTGNFDLNNPEQKAVITDYVENAFKNYQNFVQPDDLTGCYTGIDFISDAKIRFQYEIVEIASTYAWDYTNSGTNPEKNKLKGFSPSENWYLKQVDDSLKNAEGNQKAIHVYFTNNGNNFQEVLRTKCAECKPIGKAAGQFPSYNKFDRSSQAHMPDIFVKYLYMRYQAPAEFEKTWEIEVRDWFTRGDARGLSHELGHVFGLSHSNEYHKSNKCKYTIMSQKGAHPRNYLQPTEIRKIHYNLSATNLMQFVTPESHYGTTQKIYTNQSWNKPRRFYQNLELAKDVKLVISKPIILPPKSKFKLNRNSQIIFKEDGKITYPDGKEFCGWDLHRKADISK